MKTQIILALSGFTLCLFSQTRAADITKADNLSALATGGSWAGGFVKTGEGMVEINRTFAHAAIHPALPDEHAFANLARCLIMNR